MSQSYATADDKSTNFVLNPWQAAYQILATQKALGKLEKCRDEVEVVHICICDMIQNYETQDLLLGVNAAIRRANMHAHQSTSGANAQEEDNSLSNISDEIQRANNVISKTEDAISSIRKQSESCNEIKQNVHEPQTQQMVDEIISQYTHQKKKQNVLDGDHLNTRILALQQTITQKESSAPRDH